MSQPDPYQLDPSDQMPEAIRALFRELWEQLVNVHLIWMVLTNLFTGEARRVKLFTMTSPDFFGVILPALQSALVVGLCRVSEGAQTGRFVNASADALFDGAIALDLCLAERLWPLREALQAAAKPIKLHRDKVVAHIDHGIALGGDPFPAITRAEFEASLGAARAFMNMIEKHFAGSTTAYESTVGGAGVEPLVRSLELALEAGDDELAKHGLPPRWRPKS